MTAAGSSEASEVTMYEKNASWSPGSLGYLVSNAWWTSWVRYTGYTGPGASPSTSTQMPLPGGGGPRPGPIANHDLLPPEYAANPAELPVKGSPLETPLRPGLVEQQDFVVVSEQTWNRLLSLYSGGPAIARHVVSEAAPGPAGQSGERWARVALYPLRLEVVYRSEGDAAEKSAELVIEPEASLATLKQRACAELGVPAADVVLWDYSGRSLVRSLEAPEAGETLPVQQAHPERSSTANEAANGALTSSGADGKAASTGGSFVSAAEAAAKGVGTDDGAGTIPDGPAGATVGSVGAGPGGGGTPMDVDTGTAAGAPAAGPTSEGPTGYMARSLRDTPLLDRQVLLLRRKDAAESDSEGDDACGSDNDTGVATARKPPAVRRTAVGKGGSSGGGARSVAAEAAGAAAARRASAAGASGSGGGATPAPPARSSGGGAIQTGNRLGQRTLGAWDDNVMLREGQPPGLAGLTNLGNTCFMNSSLQCLAHAVPLMTAFLGGAYLQDLNRTNPLGMKGELAEAFGLLMAQLWRGGVSAVTPRAFKAKIGRFAPQFSGYAQHDSQEFLAFLLDGLHEDTNRIKNKPYVEENDKPGRPDEEVAAEAWANYRARNNSLVVDHFQGLFKSTLDCPQCSFNSVKFDPFMYLSLPLPESRRRVVEVVLVRADGSDLPCRMALELPSGASVADLLRATVKAAGLPAELSASPEAHLLAARPLRTSSTANDDELVLLSDPRMRLADALEAGGSTTSYSLRSSASADQGLVLYYYPDAASGPTAEGLAPVIVHFKRPDSRRPSWMRGVWCGAPLVLYMPEDRPPYDPEQVHKAGVTSGSTRIEYDVVGDCPLLSKLARVLRPIQHRPLAPPPAPPLADEEAADVVGDVGHAAQPAADALPPVVSAAALAKTVTGVEELERPTDRDVELVGRSDGDGAGSGLLSQPAAKEGGAVAELIAQDSACDLPEATLGVAAAAGPTGEAMGDLRPGTPALAGEERDVCAAGAGPRPGGRRISSGGGANRSGSGEQMEGLEPLVALASDEPTTNGDGAGGVRDSSMPGTPQPAASGAMEDDVVAAAGTLPAVILAGPPQDPMVSEGTTAGPAVQPFDMWSAQGPAVATPAAAPVSSAGPPFSIKLCNSKGETAMWNSSSREINKEHNREFVVLFSEACSAAAAGAAADPEGGPPGPYDADKLDNPTEHPSLQEHRRRSAAGPQPVSLDACMTTFLQPERLAESDAWYCPRCKAHVCADKKLDLWSLPEVLVVHLKRFSYTRYSRNKLDTRVEFPLHGLDLGHYVLRSQAVPPLYDLFAVSNHYGSLGGGHYTAYAKLPSPPPQASGQGGADAAGPAANADGAPPGSDERWYCFDDSHVSPVEPEAVRSPAAYVLFYRRRCEAAADPPVLPDMLERLQEQRTAALAAMDAAADGPGRDTGSPGSGNDRRPDQDQDQDQGRPSGRTGVASVSIAAAAEAAKAARGGRAVDNEDLEVQPRSLTAFTEGRRDSGPGNRLRRVSAGSAGGAGHLGADLYGDSDGLAVAAPSSPTPMSVGHTHGGFGGSGAGEITSSTPQRHDDLLPPYEHGYRGTGGASAGGYDAGDYDAFTIDAGGGAGGGGAAGGVGHGGLGAGGELGLIQPPGSPVEPDINNAEISGLYEEVDAMDSDRRRHSGSDMATSTGGNDRDDDILGDDDLGQAGVGAPPPSPPPGRGHPGDDLGGTRDDDGHGEQRPQQQGLTAGMDWTRPSIMSTSPE